MKNSIENIDELIRESIIESKENDCPNYLMKRVLTKINSYRFWQSILFDFGVKAMSILVLLFVFVLIILGFEKMEISAWMISFSSNINLIAGFLLVVYVIFFINEVIEKLLRFKKTTISI